MIEIAASLIVLTASPRNNKIPPGWEIPCITGFALGVFFSYSRPTRKSDAVNPCKQEQTVKRMENISPDDTLQHNEYLRTGINIIKGFSISDRSQMIVAPSRCGKTTVVYFLLDEFFQRFPNMQCWVWQGKTIEPVHPNIPKFQHTLFTVDDIDTTPCDRVFEAYKKRAAGDNDRSPIKLIITDWQSIKDGLQAVGKLKEVTTKLITIANNGAALGITITGDTQSANIDEWGLGSGSIRDNFDIYAVSRIEWVDGYAKGDVKALPKLIKNPDIVVNSDERQRLLSEFEYLRKGMETEVFDSSILLSTVGQCQLGITPQFDRKILRWDETTEIIISEPQPPEKQDFSVHQEAAEKIETEPKLDAITSVEILDNFVSEPVYTPLKLSKSTALKLLRQIQAEKGIGQTKAIRMLWGVSPGDSERYRNAVSEYTELTKNNCS